MGFISDEINEICPFTYMMTGSNTIISLITSREGTASRKSNKRPLSTRQQLKIGAGAETTGISKVKIEFKHHHILFGVQWV